MPGTTNKDVTATLVADGDITVTNNDGKKTYKFTKNGNFTFEYQDKAGKTYAITATVDWIDKTAPTVLYL